MSEKITLATLMRRKEQHEPFAMLTCYDYTTAVLLEEAGIDGIIVGDSLAQLVLGHRSTLAANLEVMVALAAAVRRGAPNVYLVGDMPFMSYQPSKADAIRNAGRYLVEAGCDAVKFEVDYRHLDLVEALATASIPVMAHLGYRPQSAQVSAKVVETRQAQCALQVIQDAEAMVRAGAVAILLECVTAEAAAEVSKRVAVPVVSCGSGPHCDGQVLVLHDVLGLSGSGGPRFAKAYGQVGEQIRQAAAAYVQDIHSGNFPDQEHSYHMPAQEQEQFNRLLECLAQPPQE